MSQWASIILALILLFFDLYLLQALILEHLLYQCRPLWLFKARASLRFLVLSSFEAIASTLFEILLLSGDGLLLVFALLTICLQGRVIVSRFECHSHNAVPDRTVLQLTIHAQVLLILTHTRLHMK